MFNPFKKAKKAIDTKLKKAAVTAALVALLSGLAVRFDVPVAKDAIEGLASAVSEVVVQIMDAPEEEKTDDQ